MTAQHERSANKLILRDIEVFKPYTNEIPEQLLVDAGVSDDDVERWIQALILRVAKLEEAVLGVYAMQREGVRFELYGIVVAPQVRRQGLGRWLVGHAIGVAESKGGRHLWTARSGSSRLFQHIGFTRHEVANSKSRGILQFDMIQE